MGRRNRYSTTDVSLIPDGSTKWKKDYVNIFDFYTYKGFTHSPVAYQGGVWGFKPPEISEILTKLSRIPCSMEYTSVTT
jgi:hypothetical protein